MIRILFLSVARDGIVSLWDTETARDRGALKGECFVNLRLTAEQSGYLDMAQRVASVDNQQVDR